jgi:hypothetical protein
VELNQGAQAVCHCQPASTLRHALVPSSRLLSVRSTEKKNPRHTCTHLCFHSTYCLMKFLNEVLLFQQWINGQTCKFPPHTGYNSINIFRKGKIPWIMKKCIFITPLWYKGSCTCTLYLLILHTDAEVGMCQLPRAFPGQQGTRNQSPWG